jgi:hypothetical protein
MQLAFIFNNPQRSALLALHMPALDIHARVSNVTASECANVMVDHITQRISDNMIARQYLVGRDHERMSRWSVYFQKPYVSTPYAFPYNLVCLCGDRQNSTGYLR